VSEFLNKIVLSLSMKSTNRNRRRLWGNQYYCCI